MSSGRNKRNIMSNQYTAVAYTADVAGDDTSKQTDMLLPSECPKYHYFDSSWNACLPCSRLCRNIHKCHRRAECDSYRSDFMGQNEVPPWIIIIVVVVILLILLGISVFLVMKFKMKLCELCRGCKFKDTQREKKNRFGARDGSTRSSKSLILPPRIPIQQGYEKPPIMIDIEYSRKRSMMDRFFSSIAAHPPTYGIDEMEPLKPPKPERTKSKPKEKREIRRSLDQIGRDTDRDSEKKQFIDKKSIKDDSVCDVCVKGLSDDVKMSHDSGSTTVDIKHAPSETSILKNNDAPVNSSLHSLNGWVDHNPHLPRDLSTPLDGPVPSLPILYALTRTSNPSSRNSKTSLNTTTGSGRGSADNVTRGYPQTTV